MTKNECEDILTGLRLAFLYGLTIDHKVSQSELATEIAGKLHGFERENGQMGSFSLNELALGLADRDHRRVIQGNYKLFLRHGLIHRTHEIITWYCDETQQFQKYKEAPWFQFVRVVRNVLSHHDGAVLSRWIEPKIQAVKWRERELTPADVGSVVTLDPWETVQLHVDMVGYFKEHLA